MSAATLPVDYLSPPPVAQLVPRRRLAYGDMIRILGTIAVVVGHVCDMKLSASVLSHDWWVLLWVDSAARWAVPAYIMLSGALLLDPNRPDSAKLFYRKRLARIGVPLVFWTAVFMYFSVHYTHWVNTSHDAWMNLLAGHPYTHMHFIFRIAALYALTPMLRVFLKNASRRMIGGTVFVMLIFSAADSVRNAFTHTELSAFINFTPFMGYYLCGYLLRDIRMGWAGFLSSLAMFIGSIVALALGTGALVKEYGFAWYPSPAFLLMDFLSPVRIVMAISGWLVLTHLFRNPWPKSKRGQGAIAWLASTTLGLYLIHPLFRETLWMGDYSTALRWLGTHLHSDLTPAPDAWINRYGGAWPTIWLAIPFYTALVYIPALLSTAILMKIPVVRRITG